jgi:hypothetical protein
MASTTGYAGDKLELVSEIPAVKTELFESIGRLSSWLERNDYRGYDTFDGLNAKIIRSLTFENTFLRTVLQQGVRRFPLNTRPLLGIQKSHSTKGMGFLARGFMRLHASTGEKKWQDNAEYALQWLLAHQSIGYSGSCWGNHFDYQSRTFYLPKGVPTVVWTALIGHAFLDGYSQYNKEQYLQTAVSACEHILRDLNAIPDGRGVCISYIPGLSSQVHNANVLGGSLLARTYAYTGREKYQELAQKAMQYTAQYQRPDGSWWYGEKNNLHWVDNFHTAYVLDSFKYYSQYSGDHSYDSATQYGYKYWRTSFFLPDGTPKYYKQKVRPLDIQCCSQAIDTLAFFSDRDSTSLELAIKVARWTIRNMQDPSGYFYYRRYASWLANRTPTLHWGQATMLCALSGLYKQISTNARMR